MTNANEPAYPAVETSYVNRDDVTVYERTGGLTKREAFAMAAMQGILAGRQFTATEGGHVAYFARQIADNVLDELAKEPTP